MSTRHVNSAECACGPVLHRDGSVFAHLDPRVPKGKTVVIALPDVDPDACQCGDADCMYIQVGYPFCRPCDEHHRPPECAIDEHGRALNWEGTPWEELP